MMTLLNVPGKGFPGPLQILRNKFFVTYDVIIMSRASVLLVLWFRLDFLQENKTSVTCLVGAGLNSNVH